MHAVSDQNSPIQPDNHDYTQAIKLQPGWSAAYNNRANAYAVLLLFDQAICDYNRALENNTGHLTARENRDRVLRLRRLYLSIESLRRSTDRGA